MPVSFWHFRIMLMLISYWLRQGHEAATEQYVADSGFTEGGTGRKNRLADGVVFVKGHRPHPSDSTHPAAITGRPGTAVLGWRRTAVVGIAGLVAAAAPIAVPLLADAAPVVPMLAHYSQPPMVDWSVALAFSHRMVAVVAVLTYGVVALLLGAVTVRLDPPVRRRLVALVAPTATLLVVIQLGLDYAFAGAVYVLPPVLPASIQLPLLLSLPVAALALSLLRLRRRERRDV